MKRKLLLYTSTGILTALFFTAACSYNTDIANPGDYVQIYMPQAVEIPSKRTFVMTDTAHTIIFGAAYGGPDYPTQNIEVEFKVDESLVQQFNEANETDYAVMPEGSYVLESTSGIIKRGALKTDPLRIKVKTKGILVPFKPYLLPVSISQVNGGLSVNENLKTSYFLIEGHREGINIKIMSYGIGSGNKNMDALATSINIHQPDFLVIREIDKNTTRSGPADLPAILSPLIGMPNYVFANALNYQNGEYGCVVYSKYPIVESNTYMLPTSVSEKGPLAVIKVQINDNQQVIFAGTHLNANATRRSTQTPALLDIMKEHTDIPVILAGNFNDKPTTGETYVQLATQFSFPCSSCPPNYPVSDPQTNTDYVMFKPADKFRVLDHSVGSSSVSNHLPVITQLQLYKE